MSLSTKAPGESGRPPFKWRLKWIAYAVAITVLLGLAYFMEFSRADRLHAVNIALVLLIYAILDWNGERRRTLEFKVEDLRAQVDALELRLRSLRLQRGSIEAELGEERKRRKGLEDRLQEVEAGTGDGEPA